jgi:hypothetical protein
MGVEMEWLLKSDLISDQVTLSRHWSGSVDAEGYYLNNVGGITCLGDVNVGGTFKINGVPLTAFYIRPPAPTIRYTGVSTLNGLTNEVEIVPGTNIQIHQEGNKIQVSSMITTGTSDVTLEAGDNINLERNGNNYKINSDPGDWGDFTPRLIDDDGKIIKGKAMCQYIVFGPVCTIQMYVETENVPLIRATLPIAAYGPVKQSLNGHELRGAQIIFKHGAQHFASGSYRIA